MAPVANRFREMVSGEPNGRPAWVKYIEEGEDEDEDGEQV